MIPNSFPKWYQIPPQNRTKILAKIVPNSSVARLHSHQHMCARNISWELSCNTWFSADVHSAPWWVVCVDVIEMDTCTSPWEILPSSVFIHTCTYLFNTYICNTHIYAVQYLFARICCMCRPAIYPSTQQFLYARAPSHRMHSPPWVDDANTLNYPQIQLDMCSITSTRLSEASRSVFSELEGFI